MCGRKTVIFDQVDRVWRSGKKSSRNKQLSSVWDLNLGSRLAMANRENKRNYYRILFIQPDAPLEIVQASYRTLMQKLRAHPDLGGDDWNASVINEAYSILSDAEKRNAYDRGLFQVAEYRVLGKQHATQRSHGLQGMSGPAASWRPFRPENLD